MILKDTLKHVSCDLHDSYSGKTAVSYVTEGPFPEEGFVLELAEMVGWEAIKSTPLRVSWAQWEATKAAVEELIRSQE